MKKALKALFEKTHILYTINVNYVILKRKPVQQISTSYTNINRKVQQVQRRHTLSGYVRDESGESLINATIYDLTDGIGTTGRCPPALFTSFAFRMWAMPTR